MSYRRQHQIEISCPDDFNKIKGKDGMIICLRIYKQVLTAQQLTHILSLYTRLRELDLRGCEIDFIPAAVFEHQYINDLNLSGIQNLKFEKVEGGDNRLQRIRMEGCGLKELSDNFPLCNRLYTLGLNDNEFTELPDVLSGFPELSHVHIMNNPLASNSSFAKVKKLNFVDTRNTPLAEDLDALFMSRNISLLGFDKCLSKMNLHYLGSFSAALTRSPLSMDRMQYYQNKMKHYKRVTDIQLTMEEKLECLCIPMMEFVEKVRKDVLDAYRPKLKDQPLQKGSVVYASGKLEGKKTELKVACEAMGMTYSRTLKKEVTHIILGKQPSCKVDLSTSNVVFLSEGDFHAVRRKENASFLESAPEAITDKLMDLIESRESKNLSLAIEMMKTGGVPESMIYELLFLVKSYEGDQVLKPLTPMLKKVVPTELEGVLKNRSKITWIMPEHSYGMSRLLEDPDYDNQDIFDMCSMKESDIYDRLKKVEDKWSEDFCLWYGLAYFKRRHRGLRYTCRYAEVGHPYRKEATELLFKDGCLDWSAAYGYDGDWWGENERRDGVKILFPTEMENKERVTSLDLHKSKLSMLPEGIEQFKNLKEINLSINGLRELPDSFKQLTKLEKLDLSDNHFKTIPKVLLEMPWLKEINISKQINARGKKLEISVLDVETMGSCLPNCKICYEVESTNE